MKSRSAARPNTSAPAGSRATYPSATVRTSSPRARLRGSSTGTTKAGSVTTRRTPIPGSAATSSARERGAPQGTLAPLVPLSGAELHFKARHLLSHRLELGPGRLRLQHLLFVRRGIAVLRRRGRQGCLSVAEPARRRVPPLDQLLFLFPPCFSLVHGAAGYRSAPVLSRNGRSRRARSTRLLSRSLHEKSPAARAFFSACGLLRDGLDVDGLVAFRPGGHIERHLLVFLQGLEAAALDRREVREQILAAAVRGDEPETLGVVEPLDRTCTHLHIS